MVHSAEDESDERKEFIETVVKACDVMKYIAEGYKTHGHQFLDNNVLKIKIRKRIEVNHEG